MAMIKVVYVMQSYSSCGKYIMVNISKIRLNHGQGLDMCGADVFFIRTLIPSTMVS